MEGFCGGVWQQVGSACIGAAGARAASKRPGATEPPGKRAHHRGCVHGSRRSARLVALSPPGVLRTRGASGPVGERARGRVSARQVLRRRISSERIPERARPPARAPALRARTRAAIPKRARAPDPADAYCLQCTQPIPSRLACPVDCRPASQCPATAATPWISGKHRGGRRGPRGRHAAMRRRPRLRGRRAFPASENQST